MPAEVLVPALKILSQRGRARCEQSDRLHPQCSGYNMLSHAVCNNPYAALPSCRLFKNPSGEQGVKFLAGA